MLSYRTPEEFGERFDAAPEVINGRVRVAAEDYLDAAGAQYVARTPVTAYLRLSESIDLHRVDPAAILPPTVVVAVEGDRRCRWPTWSAWSKGWARAAACAFCARPMATTPSSKKPIALTRSSPPPSVLLESPHEPARQRAVL